MKFLEYQASFGPVCWQEGYEQELAGLSVEAQWRCYAVTEYKTLTKVPYRELEQAIRESSVYTAGTMPVPERWYAVMKDGVMVGAGRDAYARDEMTGQWEVSGQKTLLPYEGYVYETTSDNNGAGYKEREWYRYLICLPSDHTLW